MGKNRTFLQRRRARRLVDPQVGARTAHVLYETAWATAWPHLDDWFKTGAFLLQRSTNRPLI